MKIERLNAKARQICLGISNHRTKSFKDTSFAKAFGEFCAATDYQDTDPDNFLVYVKLYGQDDRFRNRNFQSENESVSRTSERLQITSQTTQASAGRTISCIRQHKEPSRLATQPSNKYHQPTKTVNKNISQQTSQ